MPKKWRKLSITLLLCSVTRYHFGPAMTSFDKIRQGVLLTTALRGFVQVCTSLWKFVQVYRRSSPKMGILKFKSFVGFSIRKKNWRIELSKMSSQHVNWWFVWKKNQQKTLLKTTNDWNFRQPSLGLLRYGWNYRYRFALSSFKFHGFIL